MSCAGSLHVFTLLVALASLCAGALSSVPADGYDMTALSALARKASLKDKETYQCPEYTKCVPRFQCGENDFYRSAADKVYCGEHQYADYVCCKTKAAPSQEESKKEGPSYGKDHPEGTSEGSGSHYEHKSRFARHYEAPYYTPRPYGSPYKSYNDYGYGGQGCYCPNIGGYGQGGYSHQYRPIQDYGYDSYGYDGYGHQKYGHQPWRYGGLHSYGKPTYGSSYYGKQSYAGHQPHSYKYGGHYGKGYGYGLGHGFGYDDYNYNPYYPSYRSKNDKKSYGF